MTHTNVDLLTKSAHVEYWSIFNGLYWIIATHFCSNKRRFKIQTTERFWKKEKKRKKNTRWYRLSPFNPLEYDPNINDTWLWALQSSRKSSSSLPYHFGYIDPKETPATNIQRRQTESEKKQNKLSKSTNKNNRRSNLNRIRCWFVFFSPLCPVATRRVFRYKIGHFVHMYRFIVPCCHR